jgi:hypothetical protein
MGGESGRHVGHTGTGCYKNHEHSMLHPAGLGGFRDNRRRQSGGLTVAAVSAAAIAAATTTNASTATNITTCSAANAGSNNLVDLSIKSAFFQIENELAALC